MPTVCPSPSRKRSRRTFVRSNDQIVSAVTQARSRALLMSQVLSRWTTGPTRSSTSLPISSRKDRRIGDSTWARTLLTSS